MKPLFSNKRVIIRIVFFLSVILLLSFSRKETPVSVARQFLPGDTTTFVANPAQGWSRYSSYQEIQGDSIRFELLLFRTVPQGVNWHEDSEVGTINSSYAPLSDRVFEYAELPRFWRITIQPDGKCFFKILSGPVPLGNPVVLPILTKYKK